MSLRLFVYYCAVCGGCAALIGWAMGRLAGVKDDILQDAIKALFLGMVVALALGLIDALWNGHAAQAGRLLQRVGVVLGAVLSLLLEAAGKGILGKTEGLWMPSLTGFVALGLCIGLLIGLAQVILKEAWLKVEEGFRPGRELILSKAEVTIGRGEGNDFGVSGAP